MLEVEDLFFSYQYRPILKKLSFKVGEGQILKIEGANGTGKTTLIKVIAGLLRPQKGSITFTSGNHTYTDYRPFLEYLPSEGNGLFAELDAVKNLNFWARLRNQDHNHDEIMKQLRHWDLDQPFLMENFPVGRFSTGMKRRLALARVILSKAPLWLLDEPLFGLDSQSTEKFRQCLQSHINEGGCVIMVSHDLTAFENLDISVLSIPPVGRA